MTKKEKLDEARRLKALIDARKPPEPKAVLTDAEMREKRKWEITRRDRAKDRIDDFTGHVVKRDQIEKWRDALMNKW